MSKPKDSEQLHIRKASINDVPLILKFIRELAEFEKLSSEVKATEDDLQQTLFGRKNFAEVLIGEHQGNPVAFALYFFNYSTFLGKPGIYLEDLFVQPHLRSKGFGQQLLSYIAQVAIHNRCGRIEWSVLDWNTKAIEFYQRLGAQPQSDWTMFRLTGDAITNLAQFNH